MKNYYSVLETAYMLRIPAWKLRYLIRTDKVIKPTLHIERPGKASSRNSEFYSQADVDTLARFLKENPDLTKVRNYRRIG